MKSERMFAISAQATQNGNKVFQKSHLNLSGALISLDTCILNHLNLYLNLCLTLLALGFIIWNTKVSFFISAKYPDRFASFLLAEIYKPTWIKIGLRLIFVLRWNKNLSFLPFTHPIGGGQLPKNKGKIL